MVIIKPAVATVDAVTGGDMGVGHLPERRELVLVDQAFWPAATTALNLAPL